MSQARINSIDAINPPAVNGDVGFDLFAISDPIIVGQKQQNYYYSSVEYIEYDTGLIIAPEEGLHLFVFPRSSLSKTNLIQANHVGIIDNGYRGTIKIRFKYHPQPQDLVIVNQSILMEVNTDKIFAKGDRIAQAVFAQIITPELIQVSSFEETERSNNGFGSTGS